MERKEIKINDIIFFVGYSGWSKNQLKEEIIKKYWITKNDKYLDLFNDNLKDWSEIIDDSKYYLWKNFPKKSITKLIDLLFLKIGLRIANYLVERHLVQ